MLPCIASPVLCVTKGGFAAATRTGQQEQKVLLMLSMYVGLGYSE